jgi:hypothetical protein
MLKLIVRLAKGRTILALVAGLTVFGAVFAFAATLNVGTTALSAGNATVSSCDSDGVNATYTLAYDSAIPGYKIAGVTVNGINAACAGKSVTVNLTDASNASLASATKTFASGTTLSFTTGTGGDLAPATPIQASSVANVNAVING